MNVSEDVRPIPVRARVARACRALGPFRGWHSLVNKIVPEEPRPFVIRNGRTSFAGNLQSYVDRQVYLFGSYEGPAIARFLSQVPPSRRGTILDIGANAGTHSLEFAREFRSVHSFEPNPMLWAQFERNVALNGLPNVTLHRLGLGDQDAELTLRMIDKPNYGLGTFLAADQYDLPLRPVATAVVRNASEYLEQQGIGPIDAVKIDVQGFEGQVLRGLANVLRRDRPVVWCELGIGSTATIRNTTDLATFIPFEFRCFELSNDATGLRSRLGLRERKGDLTTADYFLVPT